MDHDDWNQHWEDFAKIAAINPANQYRNHFILKQIPAGFLHVLDIGCGQGILIRELIPHRTEAVFYGIDISEKSISIANKQQINANFIQLNMLLLPEPLPAFLDNNIDVAICSEVLEHIDDPLLFLQNIKPFLKKDASLIITVPGGLRTAYDKYLGHRKHYSKKSLTDLLHRADYHIEKIWAAGFPFFNLYKMLIFMRGHKMIRDAKINNISFLQKSLSRLFSFLFRFNLPHFGWQLVAVVKKQRGFT